MNSYKSVVIRVVLKLKFLLAHAFNASMLGGGDRLSLCKNSETAR